MKLFAELKRRNVFRAAMAYLVASWLVMEAADVLVPVLGLPSWTSRLILLLLVLCFVPTLILSWAYEVTPDGLERESEMDAKSARTKTSNRLDLITIVMVLMAVGLFSIDRLFIQKSPDRTDDSLQPAGPDKIDPLISDQLLQVHRLRDKGDYQSAFALATKLAHLLPASVSEEELWGGFSWSTDIDSEPTGAVVYRQSVDSAGDAWEELGTTPLTKVRFAVGEGYRLRFELDGHRTVELLDRALVGVSFRGVAPINPVKLEPVDLLPESMVRVPGFTRDLVEHSYFYMDRFEVTNKDYEEFIRAGGYKQRKYWKHPFLKDGREIAWAEAMSAFVDESGRPGPASWSGGTFPNEKADYPVGGVSWYEAAAYGEFVGKQLPTAAHHAQARRFERENGWHAASRSNLSGTAPRPVGTNNAMNTTGVYDLVGNVREWCWNETDNQTRCTGGGAWTDAFFHSGWIIPKSPWDRDPTLGFRLVKTFDTEERLARLKERVEPPFRRDYRDENPASAADVEVYKRFYAYDPIPLNAEVVRSKHFEHWTRNRVEFDLPYGERGGAILYVPNGFDPPFSPVIYWGGSGILNTRSEEDEWYLHYFDFLVRSGRIVALPIFKGTYDRDVPESDPSMVKGSIAFRDTRVRWVQELSRTIDYLESRDDIESDSIDYLGHSWGSALAPIVLAVEDRINAAVLHVGGLWVYGKEEPEAEPFNFVNLVHTPTLMLNGRYDIVFPFESSQLPMFALLGTPTEHKRHHVVPASHRVPREVYVREILDWFDRYDGLAFD